MVRAWKHPGTHFEPCSGGKRPSTCPHLPDCLSLTEGFGRYLPDEGQPYYEVRPGPVTSPFPMTLHGLTEAIALAITGSLGTDKAQDIVKTDGGAESVIKHFEHGREVKSS